MSSEQEQVRQLAERIARRVAASKQQQPAAHSSDAGELNDEVAELRQSLAGLQQRLAQIESHLAPADRAPVDYQQTAASQTANPDAAPATRSPWLSGIYVPATHPSQEKFGVEEATVAELVDFFEGTKTCELEPGGKPCDHCAMCSSRGF
jgi:hypothetical protein